MTAMVRLTSWERDALTEINRAVAAGEIEIARDLWRFAEARRPNKHASRRACSVSGCYKLTSGRVCREHRGLFGR